MHLQMGGARGLWPITAVIGFSLASFIRIPISHINAAAVLFHRGKKTYTVTVHYKQLTQRHKTSLQNSTTHTNKTK